MSTELQKYIDGELKELNGVIKSSTSCRACCVEMRKLQSEVLTYLATRTRNLEEVSVDADTVAILKFLRALYLGISAFGIGILSEEMITKPMMDAGMFLPFVGPSQQEGSSVLGVPKTFTVCDNVHELCRLAAASIATFLIYMSVQQNPLSSDHQYPEDVTLALNQMAVNNLMVEEQAGKFSAEMEALGVAALDSKQLAWSLLLVRAEMFTQMSKIHQVLMEPPYSTFEEEALIHRTKLVEYSQLGHKTMLQAVKVLPAVPYGYLAVGLSAAKANDARAAFLFLQRCSALASEQGQDVLAVRCLLMLATLTVMGGAGGETFKLADAKALQKKGLDARDQLRTWLPEGLLDFASRSDTQEVLIADKLVKAAEERGQGREAQEVISAVIQLQAPSSLPAGAFQQMPQQQGR